MEKNLQDYRRSYEKFELRRASLETDPIQQFQKWFEEQEGSSELIEVNAMTLSCVGSDGFPKSRVVLLKSFSNDGFVFFTNYESEKGKAILENPHVCLSFFWPNTQRQIIIKGKAEKVEKAVSQAYFHSRPFESQLAAVTSNQSSVVPNRAYLEDKMAALKKQYDQKVPYPKHWGGFLVRPVSVEFWQGGKNRLHDRFLYQNKDNRQWNIDRLAP